MERYRASAARVAPIGGTVTGPWPEGLSPYPVPEGEPPLEPMTDAQRRALMPLLNELDLKGSVEIAGKDRTTIKTSDVMRETLLIPPGEDIVFKRLDSRRTGWLIEHLRALRNERTEKSAVEDAQEMLGAPAPADSGSAATGAA
jgi:hypothetical protein